MDRLLIWLWFTLPLIIFFLPVVVLSFIVAYFTKTSSDLQINTWKARFKPASIVAKTASALVIFYSLSFLSLRSTTSGWDALAGVLLMIPFYFVLIIVWFAAFLTSLIPIKNRYLLVLINILIFAIGCFVVYQWFYSKVY